MDAKLATLSLDTSSVIDRLHPPVVQVIPAATDTVTIVEGNLVAKDDAGELIAHAKVSGVAMTGTINGTNDDFTATLAPVPVLPGSVRIDNNNAAGAQVITDDGHGNLVGHGTGTVNYITGAVVVAITTPPETGKTVLIAHKTKPVGVLTSDLDTTVDDAGIVLRHGTVVLAKLLRDAAAPDAEDLAALADIGIYAL